MEDVSETLASVAAAHGDADDGVEPVSAATIAAVPGLLVDDGSSSGNNAPGPRGMLVDNKGAASFAGVTGAASAAAGAAPPSSPDADAGDEAPDLANLFEDYSTTTRGAETSYYYSYSDDEGDEEVKAHAVRMNRAADFVYFRGRDENHGLVGLSNQGATCYMNSLLQTLFWTPEFRQALYSFRFDAEKDKEETCIGYQLQLLFARMQLGVRPTAETKSLTTSFGWTASDVFQQHDVQELMRVLFDVVQHALEEQHCALTPESLYRGELVDQIECCECHGGRSRVDYFEDVPLVIRDVSDVNAALQKFVESELLEGDNQYFCEACNKKVDARKGLKFKKLPYVLVLHLKRFDFDWNLGRRIKLNNRVSFPLTLDMRPYLPAEAAVSEPQSTSSSADPIASEPRVEQDRVLAGESRGGAVEGCSLDDAPSSQSGLAEDRSSACSDSAEYGLFSVLIHSGSAMGGHYYAYIKVFERAGHWYNFNDSRISSLAPEQVEKTFGGGAAGSYGANAYMLVYRRVDPSRNVETVPAEVLPENIRAGLDREREEYEAARIDYLAHRDLIKLRIRCAERDAVRAVIVSSQNTMAEVLERVRVACGFEGVHAACDVRLVPPKTYYVYGDPKDVLTYDGRENETAEACGLINNKLLVLETRKPGTEWTRVKSADDWTLSICEWDDAVGAFREPAMLVDISGSQSVAELKAAIREHDDCRIAQDVEMDLWSYDYAEVRALRDTISLRTEYIREGHRLYAEARSGPSRIQKHFDAVRHMIQLKVVDGRAGAPEGDGFTVTIDDRRTLRDLRVVIAKRLSEEGSTEAAAGAEGGPSVVDPMGFKLLKGIWRPDEMKDVDAALGDSDLRVRDGATIMIQPGTPLNKGERSYEFKLVDMQARQFVKIGDCVLGEDEDVSVARKWAAQHLQVEEVRRVRLRDKVEDRLRRVLRDGVPLSRATNSTYNTEEIAVQLLDEPEELQPSQKVVRVQQLFGDTEEFGDPFEAVTPVGATFDVAIEHLASLVGLGANDFEYCMRFQHSAFELTPKIAYMSWKTLAILREELAQWPYAGRLEDGDAVVFCALNDTASGDTAGAKGVDSSADAENTSMALVLPSTGTASTGTSVGAATTGLTVSSGKRACSVTTYSYPKERALKIYSRYDDSDGVGVRSGGSSAATDPPSGAASRGVSPTPVHASASAAVSSANSSARQEQPLSGGTALATGPAAVVNGIAAARAPPPPPRPPTADSVNAADAAAAAAHVEQNTSVSAQR